MQQIKNSKASINMETFYRFEAKFRLNCLDCFGLMMVNGLVEVLVWVLVVPGGIGHS